jgi:hypothetical protein
MISNGEEAKLYEDEGGGMNIIADNRGKFVRSKFDTKMSDVFCYPDE